MNKYIFFKKLRIIFIMYNRLQKTLKKRPKTHEKINVN